jgi:hypothetical protein
MGILNSYSMLGALQSFLNDRGVEIEGLTADPTVRLMIDWLRLEPFALAQATTSADVLVHRYGGWSEGCATGFKFSVLRRVTERHPGGETDWLAGITLMFEPSRLSNLTPFETVSSDWNSAEAFLHAVESSAAYRALAAAKPMSVMLESGGLR